MDVGGWLLPQHQGSRLGATSGDCSAIIHPQLLLKKKSQDGCANPTDDVLLSAHPCVLHLCKRKGFVGRSAEVDGCRSHGVVGTIIGYICDQEPMGFDVMWFLHLASKKVQHHLIHAPLQPGKESRLLRAPDNLIQNVFREGASPTSPGSLG